MSHHACEVHAEQGWCPHTHPDVRARMAHMQDQVNLMAAGFADALRGIRLVAPKIFLPDGRRLS